MRPFQSTLPTRGSDATICRAISASLDFNPRSPRGGATTARLPQGSGRRYFNPRSPRGGATQAVDMSRGDTYFNPRSPRGGATCSCRLLALTVIGISIHAPHEGERPARSSMLHAVSWYFNPRSPRGGATWRVMGITGYTLSYFNPRSPRGGATGHIYRHAIAAGISIHAPHEGERRVPSRFDRP